MRITDEMKEKDLGGDDAHGGRGDLGPAERPERPHAARYCWACDAYTSAPTCKACGMPTEKVPS